MLQEKEKDPGAKAHVPRDQCATELAMSLSMMQAAFQATTNAMLATSAEGRVTGCNEKFLAMWHVPAAVTATAALDDLFDYLQALAPDPAAFRRRSQSICNDGAAPSFDRLELTDGRVIERYSNAQVIGSLAVGRVWSFADVTQARDLGNALRAETHMLELVNRIGRNLTSTLKLASVIQAVTNAGLEISSARYAAFISDPSRRMQAGTHSLRSTSGDARRYLGLRRDVEAALAAGRMRWQDPFLCDDLHAGVELPFGPLRSAAGWLRRVRCVMFVPVTSRTGEVLGALLFAHESPFIFSARTQRLVGGIAAQAAVAIDNAALYARLTSKLSQLKAAAGVQQESLERLRTLSRRLMQAEEQEGKRLGRELHDRVGANLSALLLGIELMRKEGTLAADGARLACRLGVMEETLHTTIEHVKHLLSDLRPTALDELGLMAALRHYAVALSASSDVVFTVTGKEPSPRLPPECEIAFFRIAQESWTNVLKHANASHSTLSISGAGQDVSMCVEDDGVGYEPSQRPAGLPTLGLTTMRERAEAVGAVLRLDTCAGAGVRVRLDLARNHPAGEVL